ncbi:unnamed protein product [Amoebophrya sp. A25]|nr:unnamed protein product [Amoebophrya sp. A25]|eukprot:GSA25T00000531001.1
MSSSASSSTLTFFRVAKDAVWESRPDNPPLNRIPIEKGEQFAGHCHNVTESWSLWGEKDQRFLTVEEAGGAFLEEADGGVGIAGVVKGGGDTATEGGQGGDDDGSNDAALAAEQAQGGGVKLAGTSGCSNSSSSSSAHVRLVFVSDTHGREEKMPNSVPPGDVLIHAGDISDMGKPGQLRNFVAWFAAHPHPHKICIAGNHDLTLHAPYFNDKGRYRFWRVSESDENPPDGYAYEKEFRELCAAAGIRYLCDDAVDIDFSSTTLVLANGVEKAPDKNDKSSMSMKKFKPLRFFGSPWQPEFFGWAFNLPRTHDDGCGAKCDEIPEDTDILITHGPPLGRGDSVANGTMRAGCLHLLKRVQEKVKPRIHAFGHIHEGYGLSHDGMTLFVNAATCTLQYRPENPPLVVDLKLEEMTSTRR